MNTHSHALRRSTAVMPPVGSGDTGAPVTSSLAGASFSIASGQPDPAATSALSQLPGAAVPGASAYSPTSPRVRLALAQAAYDAAFIRYHSTRSWRAKIALDRACLDRVRAFNAVCHARTVDL